MDLRARALQAAHVIAASANIEYRDYLGAADVFSSKGQPTTCGTHPASGAPPPVSAMPAARVAAGVGLALSLFGCWLRSHGGRPYVGDGLLTAGSLVGAVAIGAVVGDLIWLAVSATRKRSTVSADAQLTRMRDAWKLALLEKGMVPFLLSHLDEAHTEEQQDRATR
ncbi:hypothetical protein ACSHXN_44355 (plasmid) [Streptomyces sp. HUAS TT11]|uniref:hypothetical protein n=1 Tax=Streptomyces sp. HUAS TT11 TaxID=3447508 RepID=UPI003F65F71D